MKLSLHLVLLPSATLALVLTACATSPRTLTTSDRADASPPSSPADAGAGAQDASPAPRPEAGASAPPSAPPPPDDPASAEVCAREASMQACQQCCATEEQPAYLAFQNALLRCACADSTCRSACGQTACAATPSQPSAACQSCLQEIQGSRCRSDIERACTGSGPCTPFAECAQVACAGKR